MTDKEFEEAMRSAGIFTRYRDRDVRMSDFVEDGNDFMKFARSKNAIVEHIRQGKHIILVDVSGDGQHVAHMLTRGMLLYSIAARITSLTTISETIADFDRRDRFEDSLDEVDALAVCCAYDTVNEKPKNSASVEWFLRAFAAEKKSLILHLEEPIERAGWFSNQFRKMIEKESVTFTV
jgi:hypothetical protein